MTVLSSAPLIPIMILLCVSLVRWLNEDFGELVRHRELALAVATHKTQKGTQHRNNKP
jgi:choline-glycine betaine transporter